MTTSSPPLRASLHLGLGFLVLFLAFSVSQSFQTSSAHQTAGSRALGIVYGVGAAATFVSAWVVESMGPQLSLCVGSVSYVLFVAANIEYNEAALYASSALLGVGASVLWTAQGVYVNSCAEGHEAALALPRGSTLGLFNGIFWSLFQTNILLGSLLAAALFANDVSTAVIFIVMTAICAAGSISLCFLPKQQPVTKQVTAGAFPVSSEDDQALTKMLDHSAATERINATLLSAAAPSAHRSLSAQICHVFHSLRLLGNPRLQVLLPMMIYSGLSQSYINGSFPPLIESKSSKFFVLAALGGTDALGSMFLGRLSDRIGRVWVLSVGFVASASVIVCLLLWRPAQSLLPAYFALAVGLGVSDAVVNTQLYAILGGFFPRHSEAAFANFKLFQAGATAAAFLADEAIGFEWKSIITGGALVLGFGCLAVYDLVHRTRGSKAGSVFDCKAEPIVIAASGLESALLTTTL